MTPSELFQRHPRPWRVDVFGQIRDANRKYLLETLEERQALCEIINALPEIEPKERS